MKLKNMSREELEMLSYAEIASLILTENKKKMKIAEVFKKICDLLGLSNAEYENGISEFFEIVSTNKLFTVLPGGFCDLKVRHKTKVVVDDEDEEGLVEEESEDEEIESDEENEEIFYDDSAEDDDVCDDDELQDFVIIDEDEANS